ncbi:hypothetical protein B0T10DRAFT_481990 [Thelonectria olida]|uniref:Secreted protein n=1 Tax=Thelonectria olida TaxID=1576542 RepID=A0A9P8WCR5_9HYPO|nr:hypothetical protein B0T10DRAFT_481990 [Thelonectria olida]
MNHSSLYSVLLRAVLLTIPTTQSNLAYLLPLTKSTDWKPPRILHTWDAHFEYNLCAISNIISLLEPGNAHGCSIEMVCSCNAEISRTLAARKAEREARVMRNTVAVVLCFPISQGRRQL